MQRRTPAQNEMRMSQLQSTVRATVVNGVNVSALFETIEAIQANAEIGKFNFRLANRWMGGERNRSTIQDFTGALTEHRTGVQAFVAENGGPEVLFGDDGAPSPVEWLLHALVGCMTTTAAYHAAARGVVIHAIDSEIDGDLDLRGFLGLSEEVRKGYSAIRVRMRVKTAAPADDIKALTRMSPVFDVVSRSLPVAVSVETY
jgi:uncharacterized OsmC-like protein